ncbi:hypothetical protein K431DRAFT_273715 [Polychaeton citri CBS 116435]|uniref:Uncharacterized protein n=1 Tax=Polychaeton citri CBS 116435 TaxID=1314669 RepID=A0A9P4Q5W7_9PEZI|nr:hypothetical protein K431DRAFT_273715 [Polychaeton citri CBS 116435]
MIEYTPNCTFPTSAPSGFVNGPNIRGTTDIIWGCGSVIILSTWSVLHLNVPPSLQTSSKLQWTRKEAYLFGRKLGWMCVMLAFPEYFVGICTVNLFAAWVNHPQLEELAREDNVPWSLTHTILANTGGIALRFSEADDTKTSQQPDRQFSDSSGTDGPDATLKCEGLPAFIRKFQTSQERHLRGLGKIPWVPFGPHITLAAHARAKQEWVQQNSKKYSAEQIAPLHGNIWVLDSKQLVLARCSGVISKLPSFEKEEIDDKSKIDGLMRSVAVIQVFWFAVQLVARKIADTPSSALEISTVAFSACAFVIYVTEWAKPKDVGLPFYIDTDAKVTLEAFSSIAEAAPITFLQSRRYYIAQSCVHQVIEGRFKKAHIDRLMCLVTILSISLYGGIHLFAWSLDFPTRAEKLLWRISALTVAIAPSVSALLVLSEDALTHRTDRLSKWSVMVLAPAYVSARLYIIVASFRQLYFLPPSAFIATWASNAPHFG